MDMVMIEWMDVMSFQSSSLMDESDIEDVKPSRAWIVGFLVKEDAEHYYVAKEWWESGQFKYLHVIPKRTAILSVKKLQVIQDGQQQTQQPEEQRFQQFVQQNPPPTPPKPPKKGFFGKS